MYIIYILIYLCLFFLEQHCTTEVKKAKKIERKTERNSAEQKRRQGTEQKEREMDPQRSSDRIQYPHQDFGRDGYHQYQQHKQHHHGAISMPSLSTGQGFYTVESLQGVSSVPPRFIPHPGPYAKAEEGADDEERGRHMQRNEYYHANQLSIPPIGTMARRSQSSFAAMHPPPRPPPPSFVPDPRILALHAQQRENLHRENIHREIMRRENSVDRPPRGWGPSLPPPPPPPWTFEHQRTTDMWHDRSHSRQVRSNPYILSSLFVVLIIFYFKFCLSILWMAGT